MHTTFDDSASSFSGMTCAPKIEQLRPATSIAHAATVFKANIRMVEIEVFSYCNRKCWFCPNSRQDRISTNHLMNPETYTSVLEQLSSIEYDGMITYSRYNEPFADRIILNRIREARDRLPKALLHTNTNGDYLDPDLLGEIYSAGMRSLNIQFYLQNEQRYDHEAIRRRAQQIIARLRLPCRLVRDEPGHWLEYRIDYRDMHIRGYGRNFDINGTSRGGLVNINSDYVRTSPCLIPFWSVYIDYNAKIVPCCNFRSDMPEHSEYIVGDLNESPSLFLNYVNTSATAFRQSLLNVQPKMGRCRDCYFALEDPSQEAVAAMQELTVTARCPPSPPKM